MGGGAKPAMIGGFNTNIRYRGVTFHVQTEDSGRAHPHVSTHLYHGGTIVASEKCDYADLLVSAEPEAEVRVLMENQHKSMLDRLRRAKFDELIEQCLGASIFDDDADGSETAPADSVEPAADGSASPAATHRERIARAFGDGIKSKKPLDEVVLEYLVENARKRKHSPK